jgi:hypothetical protein
LNTISRIALFVIAAVFAIVFAISLASAGATGTTNPKLNTPDHSRTSAHVRVDASGTVRAMYNLTASAAGTTPEEIARTFLQTNRDAFHISNETASLRTDEVRSIPGGSHVRFTQSFSGIPVFRGDIIVSINGNNQVTMVVNNSKGAVHPPSTTPSLSEGDALSLARQHVGIKGRTTGKPDAAELMIFRASDGADHLAYRISMTNEDPMGDWQVFVDALGGQILDVEDLFANEHVQGSGYVYLSDPLSASRKMYGSSGFVDNNDADSDSLTAYQSLVTLDSLKLEDGVYKLKGPYCNVTDVESPLDPQYYSSTTPTGFNYLRSAQQFEAVNVFYHVTTSYKHLLDLGFSVPSLTQIRLDPHGYLGQDNSHFCPSGNWISWGEGGVDDAEDADVIWHEYGHAIMYNIIPNWGGGESGALGEGFGDYWAGSYSHSLNQWAPTDYQYNWVFNWDGHNAFWLGRMLNDPRTYPFGALEIHTAGQIWSAALMGILGDLGRDISDRLVVSSFYYLGSGTTGPDAAQAIIQADRDLYGGAHVQTLAYWLGTVKHFIDPTAFVPVIAHTPLSGNQGVQGPYDIRATITSGRGLEQQQVCVVWGRGESFTDTTVMVPTQTPSEFEAMIPGNGEPGIIHYYMVAVDTTGVEATLPLEAPAESFAFDVTSQNVSSADPSNVSIPRRYQLNQNYPNPFNPTTSISYALPAASTVSLKVYNALGQEIATLLDLFQSAGYHEAVWDGRDRNGMNFSSGTYFYRIMAQSTSGDQRFVDFRKMVMLK